jgi:hypothetical protein
MLSYSEITDVCLSLRIAAISIDSESSCLDHQYERSSEDDAIKAGASTHLCNPFISLSRSLCLSHFHWL